MLIAVCRCGHKLMKAVIPIIGSIKAREVMGLVRERCSTCHTIDDQIQKLVSAIELGPQWLEEVLAIISLKDEVEKVKKDRTAVQEKLRRMAKAYIDGLFPDEEYNRQRKLLEMELESLVVPGANAAEEAGKLIMNLRELWVEANVEEKRKLTSNDAGCGLCRC